MLNKIQRDGMQVVYFKDYLKEAGIPDQVAYDLQKFLESSRIMVYPITLDTSIFFSQIYCSLKDKGKPIPTNDMWIAAQAFEYGCVVCTHDKHFGFIDFFKQNPWSTKRAIMYKKTSHWNHISGFGCRHLGSGCRHLYRHAASALKN